jgi:hypothetical protein
MADFEMVAGETDATLTATLKENGTARDISGGTLTVYFRKDGTSTVSTYTGAGVTGTSAGVLTIDWGGTIGDSAPTKGSYTWHVKHELSGDTAYFPTGYNGKPAWLTAVVHEALG